MTESLPPKINNAYWFQGLNAASWQICLGSPLILFARELGAPAVILGLLAGLAPLTSILQLAVARYAERIGYRNLMLRGWSTRVMILIFLVALPFAAPLIGAPIAIAILLIVMLIFTVSRAIAVCSWMPWLAAIVPRSLRGFYLSHDRIFTNGGTLVALSLSGAILMQPSMPGYAAVFFLGFVFGAISLYFLNRIPEPPLTVTRETESQGSHWSELLRDKSFVRLILFSATVQVVMAGSATFTIVFVREQTGTGDGMILWLTAGAAIVGILALQLLRHRADIMGSKPLLLIVLVWWALYFALWFVLSVNGFANPFAVIMLLMPVNGFFAATYDLSLTRLLMNIAGDRPASAQYFALHSVIVSAVTGITPVLWGILLDALAGMPQPATGPVFSRYSVLFGVQWLLLALVALVLYRVRETGAPPIGRALYDSLIRAPLLFVNHLSHLMLRLARRPR